MSIHFRCPFCQSTMNSPDIMAGRPLTCPNCWEKITVPSQGRIAAPALERAPLGRGPGLDQTPDATEQTVADERRRSKPPSPSSSLGNRIARWFAALFKGRKTRPARKKKRKTGR